MTDLALPAPGTAHDAALGAVLGALAGDAVGAVLEFHGRAPKPAEVQRALRFPGGGIWRVAPGQVTDDGELTLCQLQALAESPVFSLDHVAMWYGRWIRSRPFDLGNATSAGLGPAQQWADGVSAGLAARMRLAASRASAGSKANGALMRASPLGVWGHRLDDDTLAECARADASLTHPNVACGDAVAAYAIAVASLVRAPGDRAQAWARACAWAARAAIDEVRDWLGAAERDERPEFAVQIGFVRHGFVEAFRQLRRGSDWATAVGETLLGGGDTDTNACIVGGLVGAACGAGALPPNAITAVLSCDTAAGRERPEWLHPRLAPEAVARALGANAP